MVRDAKNTLTQSIWLLICTSAGAGAAAAAAARAASGSRGHTFAKTTLTHLLRGWLYSHSVRQLQDGGEWERKRKRILHQCEMDPWHLKDVRVCGCRATHKAACTKWNLAGCPLHSLPYLLLHTAFITGVSHLAVQRGQRACKSRLPECFLFILLQHFSSFSSSPLLFLFSPQHRCITQPALLFYFFHSFLASMRQLTLFAHLTHVRAVCITWSLECCCSLTMMSR